MPFIAVNEDGQFLTNRKSTGRMYESRSTWSDKLSEAKIFTTKGAATRSGNDNGGHYFEVKEVEIRIK